MLLLECMNHIKDNNLKKNFYQDLINGFNLSRIKKK